MKRKLSVLSIVCVIIFSVCAFSACGDDIDELQMNTKYISTYDVGEEANKQSYFIFNSDGTGEYRYYLPSYNDYTVHFKYTYTDKDKSSAVCFYDSVEYGAGHLSSTTIESNWSYVLTVSKNVVCRVSSYGYSIYVNENYLKTIPNFDK